MTDRDLIAEAQAFLDAAALTSDVDIFVRNGLAIYEHMLGLTPRLVSELLDALKTAQQERDLAIAHDRQPYPTAWAYEQACKALEKHRARADAAVAELEAAQRPPLGYMPVSDSPEPQSPNGRWIVPMSAVHPTAEEPLRLLKLYEPLDGGEPSDGSRYFVAEVREAQP